MLTKKEHIMVNIATLSTKANAAIRNISAVRFTLENGVLDEFSVNVDMSSCTKAGLSVDKSTIKYWLGQPQDIQDAFKTDQEPLKAALNMFNEWCGEYSNRAFYWSVGSAFHIGILKNAYDACDIETPWVHWNLMDAVTVYAMFGFKEEKVVMTTVDKANHSASQIIRLLND